MQVFFRLDSNRSTGAGHLVRCLRLSDELARKGVNCTFICNGVGFEDFGTNLKNAGTVTLRLITAPTLVDDIRETTALLSLQKRPTLVVDSYQLDSTWE